MIRAISPYAYKLFVPFHVLAAVCFFGPYSQPIDWPVAISIWAIISGAGIAVGYHRLLSHQAFQTYRPVKWVLALIGSLAGQGDPFFWVAVHRGLHHPYADSPRDPHTPQKGFLWSLCGWQLFFTRKEYRAKDAIDILSDRFLLFLSANYFRIYWCIVGASLIFLPYHFTQSLIMGMLLALHQENIINSFCHTKLFGYKNFATNDNSVNVWPLGLILWGQGYHNNHHKFPQNSNLGVKWWEVDLTVPLVFLLRKRAVPPFLRQSYFCKKN